jgi:hypothetical protein
MGMSLVVRSVGQAMLVPALDPTYASSPAATRSLTVSTSPRSRSALSRRKLLPPPTYSTSAARTAASGSGSACSPRTLTPSGASASAIRAT